MAPVVHAGLAGGAYRPLGDGDIRRIHTTVLDVLEKIGVADPIPILKERALARGCRMADGNRLCFPRGLVEDALAGPRRAVVCYGREPAHDLDLGGQRVNFCGGGEAVSMFDHATGRYRPSTLRDTFDLARLTDRLEFMHEYSRLTIPTEITDPLETDINVAYASVAGTTKPISLSFARGEHVAPVLELLDIVAGGAGKFAERPFCQGGGCCIISPLRYGRDNSEVCVAAAALGAPVWVLAAPQAGTTAPAALAGTLAQSVAEALAAWLLVELVVPGHPVIVGAWPFVADLRTGAFSGGGGECAVLNAAAAQMINHYGLTSSVGAGMTDSKLPDCQAGYEKALSVGLAAVAGCNSISESTGMLASLMGCSYEAMVIDNEMLGCIQRALRGIEVNDETLSFHVIREAVAGDGHFLRHPQTRRLMRSEYLYPRVADRRSRAEWEQSGAGGILDRAHATAAAILATHYPSGITPEADRRIRARFPIRLPPEYMRPPTRQAAGI
jgi:trimethylamine--corrinoid protein Co-methyltransferase